MIDNRIILKTSPEGEAVRGAEITSISLDLVNSAISFNERAIIVDLTGEEVKLQATQSKYSRNFVTSNGNTPEANAQAEALAQVIFNAVKDYYLANYQSEQNG